VQNDVRIVAVVDEGSNTVLVIVQHELSAKTTDFDEAGIIRCICFCLLRLFGLSGVPRAPIRSYDFSLADFDAREKTLEFCLVEVPASFADTRHPCSQRPLPTKADGQRVRCSGSQPACKISLLKSKSDASHRGKAAEGFLLELQLLRRCSFREVQQFLFLG